MEKAGAAQYAQKENIERAILKASSEAENVEEATYRGIWTFWR